MGFLISDLFNTLKARSFTFYFAPIRDKKTIFSFHSKTFSTQLLNPEAVACLEMMLKHDHPEEEYTSSLQKSQLPFEEENHILQVVGNKLHRNLSINYEECEKMISDIYFIKNTRAWGLLSLVFGYVAKMNIHIKTLDYQKLLYCQVINTSVTTCQELLKFLLENWNDLKSFRPAPFNFLISRMVINRISVDPFIISLLFIRLSQTNSFMIPLYPLLVFFRELKVDLGTGAYNACLFQLIKLNSEKCLEVFKLLKAWNRINMMSYQFISSYLVNNKLIEEAICMKDEAFLTFPQFSFKFICGLLKSLVYNSYLQEAMKLYKEVKTKWPLDYTNEEIERTILMFLSCNDNSILLIAEFLDLILDKNGLCYFRENIVHLLAVYHKCNPVMISKVIDAIPNTMNSYCTILLNYVIRTCLCSPKTIGTQILFEKYSIKFQILSLESFSPLSLLFLNDDYHIAVLIRYADEKNLPLTPSTHYRLIQRLYLAKKFTFVCSYYKIVKSQISDIIYPKAIPYLIKALVSHNEWSNLTNLLYVVKKRKLSICLKEILLSLLDMVSKNPTYLDYPSDGAPIEELINYAKKKATINDDVYLELLDKFKSMHHIHSIGHMRRKIDLDQHISDDFSEELFNKLKKCLEIPIIFRPVYTAFKNHEL